MQQNNKHLFQRLAVAATSTVMLLSLTACSISLEKITRPLHPITDPGYTRPKEPTAMEPPPRARILPRLGRRW